MTETSHCQKLGDSERTVERGQQANFWKLKGHIKGLVKIWKEIRVLLDNVGPLNFKSLSEICLKTVKKLSVSKYCQKTVRNVSDICQYSVRCQTLSEKCLNKFGNVSKKCLRP